MELISKKSGNYVLRFERGERYPAAFIAFLKKNRITGGFFAGLGACVNPEISFYSLERKKYFTKRFRGDFEVLNLTGNVATSDGKIIIHQHIALGAKNFKAIGGHLEQMEVGGTLEIFLTPTPALTRKIDAHTGLNLLAS